LNVRETDAMETRARRATSRIVGSAIRLSIDDDALPNQAIFAQLQLSLATFM
jgi:hypothetical protein